MAASSTPRPAGNHGTAVFRRLRPEQRAVGHAFRVGVAGADHRQAVGVEQRPVSASEKQNGGTLLQAVPEIFGVVRLVAGYDPESASFPFFRGQGQSRAAFQKRFQTFRRNRFVPPVFEQVRDRSRRQPVGSQPFRFKPPGEPVPLGQRQRFGPAREPGGHKQYGLCGLRDHESLSDFARQSGGTTISQEPNHVGGDVGGIPLRRPRDGPDDPFLAAADISVYASRSRRRFPSVK